MYTPSTNNTIEKRETVISSIISEIYPFCRKARNTGSALYNPAKKYPNRVLFIIKLLEKHHIPYLVRSFTTQNCKESKPHTSTLHNIYLPGKGCSSRMLTSHHDIVNPLSDNANDNSCSVINCIAYKKLNPDAWVAILDGEEVGFLGAIECMRQIKFKEAPFNDFTPHSILNLELTGIGGTNFCYGTEGGVVNQHINSLFPDAPEYETPNNDAKIFQIAGIPATVITTLPISTKPTAISNTNGYLNTEIIKNCHQFTDSVNAISKNGMKAFVIQVVHPIMTIKS